MKIHFISFVGLGKKSRRRKVLKCSAHIICHIHYVNKHLAIARLLAEAYLLLQYTIFHLPFQVLNLL
jgi:hypothetical protein